MVGVSGNQCKVSNNIEHTLRNNIRVSLLPCHNKWKSTMLRLTCLYVIKGGLVRKSLGSYYFSAIIYFCVSDRKSIIFTTSTVTGSGPPTFVIYCGYSLLFFTVYMKFLFYFIG